MKIRLHAIAFACILAASSASQAAQTFTYAITFSPGNVATGKFSGNVNGNLITNLSNISAYINGIGFRNNGHLYNASWSAGVWTSGTGVASVDGLHNNFQFTDVNYPIDQHYSGEVNSFAQYSWRTNANSVYLALDPAPVKYFANNNASWTLTLVPEPATTAMLLAGVGVMAFLSRRRTRA